MERIKAAFKRLTRAIPGFTARPMQIQLAEQIAKAIANQSMLVAEAGTGTGKTFAYLIPCLLSGKKIIISTATKTLQDQLFEKDLPSLVRALGLSIRMQNLKGRANYLCRHRVALHTSQAQFAPYQSQHEISAVAEKLAQLKQGLRSELPEVAEDSPIWPYVTSTTDNCLGLDCSFYQSCFLTKARRRALKAGVVVINHHLFFADSQLKEEGFGELLPDTSVVVFDEAHQLAEIASDFHGERLSTRQIRELIDDLIKEWPVLDSLRHPDPERSEGEGSPAIGTTSSMQHSGDPSLRVGMTWGGTLKQYSFEADSCIGDLLTALSGKEERLSWQAVKGSKNLAAAMRQMAAIIDNILICIEQSGVESAGVKRCQERLEVFKAFFIRFHAENARLIRWLERFKQSLVFQITPFTIRDAFQQLLTRFKAAYIFTSATLTTSNSFDYFIKPLGLDTAELLQCPSPFDYQRQALLYLPRGLPDPNHPTYHQRLVERVLPIINACGGRTFFLFTSHRALKLVAELLAKPLNYPLLVQGEESKPILLARFRELGNAVLLGTATFWEGVDVKGAALSCVIIDKLPFESPSDPVTSGRMHYFKSQGRSGFDAMVLPNAVIALKQGIGRLIRDANDRGILVIADPRITAREYGREIFKSLPALVKTRDEQKVLEYAHEFTSN